MVHIETEQTDYKAAFVCTNNIIAGVAALKPNSIKASNKNIQPIAQTHEGDVVNVIHVNTTVKVLP